ncbi:hypothetical protein [Herbaspirillum sp. YR522]|uniref:hypothetical protein n=1 Tax=Herbaspirillum sp. YR522 TaxID=1144342 RepID=UPI00026F4A36|nr:hypothetical protein [Herbaspirillum sp. YR522]EJN10299.1 hypothetical protein PMI40_00100 [Herbaspirillum sp. YR522]
MRKKLISLALSLFLYSIIFYAHAQFIPFDIEAERVSPQEPIHVPNIVHQYGYADYLVEPRMLVKGANEIVHLRVPTASFLKQADRPGLVRKYEFYLEMYYPNFSGFGDSKACSALRKEVNSYDACPGQMTVGIGHSPPKNPVKTMAWLQKEIDSGGLKEDVTNKIRLNGLQFIGVDQDNPKGPYFSARAKFYTTNSIPRTVISCQEYVPRPMCNADLVSKNNPAIRITIDFGFDLLPEWEKVLAGVENSVDAMIVQTFTIYK